MATLEKNEIKKVDSKKVLVILVLVSTAFILAALLFNIVFAKNQLDLPLEPSDWNIELILSLVEMLAVLILVIVLVITAMDTTTMKFLFIPAFLAAATSITSVTLAVIDIYNAQAGLDTSLLLFLSVYATLVLAYIFLGIYTLKKSIAITFSAIFATLSLGVSIGFNVNKIIFIIQQSAAFKFMLPYLIMVCLNVGLAILIWSFCAIMPPETKDKDIIKKNIALNIILSVVTLGVFAVFWVRSISDDIAKLEGKTVNSCREAAMFFVVPFYAIFWLYTKGKKTAKLSGDADMSVLYAVHGLFLLCFFSLALMQHQLHVATGLSKPQE
ncbi:MAG: DUF4234 domain-containing protein [Eubacteriales bacterium]